MTKEKLLAILCHACDRPLTAETELLQSGYLDSLALVLWRKLWRMREKVFP